MLQKSGYRCLRKWAVVGWAVLACHIHSELPALELQGLRLGSLTLVGWSGVSRMVNQFALAAPWEGSAGGVAPPAPALVPTLPGSIALTLP